MNRLATETSPYLLQHRDNPVDWYPWGDEAFARAKEEDKPVLLSVGYSACHWCHVMAHESFEDDETAAVMNELFVNIKVDREERPDVDAIYMEATQALTGHGGWPMTVFCTPDGKPFYCGTYFPKEAREHLPSFVQICQAIAEAWSENRDQVLEQSDQLTSIIERSATQPLGDEIAPSREVLTTAASFLRQQHHAEWGGFGRAPKFPQTMCLELLLRVCALGESDTALPIVETSLDAMASGGLYDHLGGGFARYSVDDRWLVPHFEKMLYDQALLARLYLHAWQVTGAERYRQVLDETIEYVRRELTHADGGFFSAEDADSEGEEGKFYVWTPDEIRDALGDATLADEVIAWYGVTDDGNFEGTNILNRIDHRGELTRSAAIESARQQLFEVRAQRVRPGLDDKVLTEWNGLMLATLAEAAAATGNADWLAASVACGEFLIGALRRDDGRWLRAWKDGQAKTLAFAADYGALIDAFCRLAEATGEARWIVTACETADGLLDLFWDHENGGVFTTGTDAEALITRPKDFLDNATPGANSLAAVGLLRLAALTGDQGYREHGERIARMLAETAAAHPRALGHLLGAVDLVSAGPTEIVITGDRADLVRAVQARYLPNAVLAWGEPYASPLWEGRAEQGAAGRAYVCENYTCDAPIDDPEALITRLTAQ